MDWQAIVRLIVRQIEEHPSVEGAYLSGSLVNENRDAFSDIDLGIASGNSPEDFDQAYALRNQIMAAVGPPVHSIERGWEHCQMVAILYGKSQFPPVGLEVDVVFSQLQHVSEQMPYADYEIVFDRTGKLKLALDRIGRERPKTEVAQEIKQYLNGSPFFVHDALKAYRRGDAFLFQSLLEEMRKGIFLVAAARHGTQIYGSKRAFKNLSASERRVVEDSYHEFDRRTVERLVELFSLCLAAVQHDCQIEQEVKRFRVALRGLL